MRLFKTAQNRHLKKSTSAFVEHNRDRNERHDILTHFCGRERTSHMVKNLSGKAQFYCMNHPVPIPLIVRQRTDDRNDNFFACPKYMRKDDAHPDGFDREAGETGCANRLSFSDAADLLDKFNKTVETDLMNGEISDYQGYRFTHRQIQAQILKYGGKELRIGILNRKAIQNG